MALYITFALLGCLLIFLAVKGTEYQHQAFSIPAVATKFRIYMFIAGALCILMTVLLMNEEDSALVTTDYKFHEPTLPSQKTQAKTGKHTMKLYCCDTNTREKMCPIDIALGMPGLPCYCVGSGGPGIICQ